MVLFPASIVLSIPAGWTPEETFAIFHDFYFLAVCALMTELKQRDIHLVEMALL